MLGIRISRYKCGGTQIFSVQHRPQKGEFPERERSLEERSKAQPVGPKVKPQLGGGKGNSVPTETIT